MWFVLMLLWIYLTYKITWVIFLKLNSWISKLTGTVVNKIWNGLMNWISSSTSSLARTVIKSWPVKWTKDKILKVWKKWTDKISKATLNWSKNLLTKSKEKIKDKSNKLWEKITENWLKLKEKIKNTSDNTYWVAKDNMKEFFLSLKDENKKTLETLWKLFKDKVEDDKTLELKVWENQSIGIDKEKLLSWDLEIRWKMMKDILNHLLDRKQRGEILLDDEDKLFKKLIKSNSQELKRQKSLWEIEQNKKRRLERQENELRVKQEKERKKVQDERNKESSKERESKESLVENSKEILKWIKEVELMTTSEKEQKVEKTEKIVEKTIENKNPNINIINKSKKIEDKSLEKNKKNEKPKEIEKVIIQEKREEKKKPEINSHKVHVDTSWLENTLKNSHKEVTKELKDSINLQNKKIDWNENKILEELTTVLSWDLTNKIDSKVENLNNKVISTLLESNKLSRTNNQVNLSPQNIWILMNQFNQLKSKSILWSETRILSEQMIKKLWYLEENLLSVNKDMKLDQAKFTNLLSLSNENLKDTIWNLTNSININSTVNLNKG